MTSKSRDNNNLESLEDKNTSVVKENNFTSSKDSELVFTFSMPVTPPKSPRLEKVYVILTSSNLPLH